MGKFTGASTALLVVWAVVVAGVYCGGLHCPRRSASSQDCEIEEEETAEKQWLEDSVEELWLEQPLDHFGRTSNATWLQRFLRETRWYLEGGPVLLFIGGENPLEEQWQSENQVQVMASEFGALVLVLEHRFYGHSRPTGRNLSMSCLQYLCVEQALEDMAYFIRWYRDHHPELSTAPWVVIGCSYSGALAAWARLDYADIVHGAVAFSAPIDIVANNTEYLEVVSKAISSRSSVCLEAVRQAFMELEKMEASDIQDVLGLCPTYNFTLATVVQSLSSWIANCVQYNSQNGSTDDIGTFCETFAEMRHAMGPGPNSFLKALGQMYQNDTEDEFSLTDCSALNDTDPQSQTEDEYLKGKLQWSYQVCSELGGHVTTDSPNQPFGNTLTMEFNAQDCQDDFTPDCRYSVEDLMQSAERTNRKFGGIHPNVTNVIFVCGDEDPWHPLSVTRNLSDSAPAIVIHGVSHCQELDPESPSQPQQLRDALRLTRHYMQTIFGLEKKRDGLVWENSTTENSV